VVVGHGVQQLLLPYFGLLLAAVVLVSGYISVTLRLRDKPKSVRTIMASIAYLVVSLLVLGPYVLLMFYVYVDAASFVGVRESGGLSLQYWAFVALNVFVWGLIFTMSKVRKAIPKSEALGVREPSSFWESLRLRHQHLRTYPRHYTALAGLGSASFFFLVLSINLLDTTPPLSSVEISGQRPLKGELLTHVDGFWYVFERREDTQEDKQEKDKQEAKLVAIPDDKVEDVQVSE
jgi:hypothetical protein